MAVHMHTPCDLRVIPMENAPLVAILEDLTDGSRQEYRYADGSFVVPLAFSPDVLEIAARESVPLGIFGGDFAHHYKLRCNWIDFKSRSVRSEIEPRDILDWNASNIDDSDAETFRTAMREVMDRVVVIDGRLWQTCPEPSLCVRWGSQPDRKDEPTEAVYGKIVTGDISRLLTRPGTPSHDLSGLRNTYNRVISTADGMRFERCFSLAEQDRIKDFMASFKGGFKVKNQDSRKFTVIDGSYFSPDFDALELGRAARETVGAWDDIESHLNRAKGKKWKGHIDDHVINGMAGDIESAMRDFEEGKGPPDILIEETRRLRNALVWVVNTSWRRFKLEMDNLLPPSYFGDADNMAIEFEMADVALKPRRGY
jgi:hypothetical protein